MKSRQNSLAIAIMLVIAAGQSPFAAVQTAPDKLVVKGIIRDFKTPHDDFEKRITALQKGCVGSTLQNGLPKATSNNKCDIFKLDEWYKDVAGVNQAMEYTLTLSRKGGGDVNGLAMYEYSSSSFFPIDNKLGGNQGRNHNYHFTLAIPMEFTYQKGMKLTFSGDDDVWVFIDNKLALDLGGVHAKETATIDDAKLVSLGLVENKTYRLDFFFAERHTTESNFVLTTSLPLKPNVDVWIADPAPDAGVEPNNVSKNIWTSPDIWVRNAQDAKNTHQEVKAGQDNYVYVKVRNRGGLAAVNTKVEVYRTNPTLGNQWPKGWDLVGTTVVENLNPGEEKIVNVRWDQDKIPKPGHYCFYTRLLNDQDPMTTPEGANAQQNTRNNNNIAWRNFNVIGFLNKVANKAEVIVQNSKEVRAKINLVFEEPDGLLSHEGTGILVDLGPLFNVWKNGGSKGQNIQEVAGTTQVQLLKGPAKIEGIQMEAGKEVPIQIETQVFKPMPGAGTTRDFNLSVQELIDGELAGGVDFTLTTRAQDTDTDSDGIKDVTDEDDDNDGIPDTWENEQGLNALEASDAQEDLDEDGLSNLKEYTLKNNPKVADRVDVWVADPAPDNGTEPNKVSSNIWTSPDVWVRNQSDKVYKHQEVKKGQDNFVYVKVRNRGLLPASNTKVEVYFTMPSLGNAWPKRWTLLGTGTVDNLAVGENKVVEFRWEKERILNTGHYCFYVRLLNDKDPMTFLETSNAVQNTFNNNNIAWRNFNVIGLTDKVADKVELKAQNPTNKPVKIDLVFQDQDGLLNNDGVGVIVDLGELFHRWQDAGGKKIGNVEVLAGTTKVKLIGAATLEEIPMEADEELPIQVELEALKPTQGEGASRDYHLSVQEKIDGEVIGGVDFTVTTRAQDSDSDGDGIKDVTDEDNDNDGIPDVWETQHGTNPLDHTDAQADRDGDGVSNQQEYLNHEEGQGHEEGNTGGTGGESIPNDIPWATHFSGNFVAVSHMGEGSGTDYFGNVIWNNDSMCTLTQKKVAQKAWTKPQWLKTKGHLVLFRQDQEGHQVQGGKLKVKLSLGSYVVHPNVNNAADVQLLAGEKVTCPSEMPNCDQGQEGTYSPVSEQEFVSDENGVVEFEVLGWWPGVPSSYQQAANLMTEDGKPDWSARNQYIIENHYEGTVRGEDSKLLGNLDRGGQSWGLARDVAWNASWGQCEASLAFDPAYEYWKCLTCGENLCAKVSKNDNSIEILECEAK